MTRQDYISGFVKAWKDLASFILEKDRLLPEDYQICKDALKVLDSDVPKRLLDEICDSPVVHQNALDEAEEFDKSLMRLKLIMLPLSIEDRIIFEKMAEGCISLEKMLLEAIVRKQGRLIG